LPEVAEILSLILVGAAIKLIQLERKLIRDEPLFVARSLDEFVVG